MTTTLWQDLSSGVSEYKVIPNSAFRTYCSDGSSANRKSNTNTRKFRKLYNSFHFSYEAVRRATFDSWSYHYINKDELAKAGFFCMKRKDQVQCYFCRGIVGFWEEGDRPFREHEKHFPNCPLVQGSLTSNVPLAAEQEENVNALLNRCLMRTLEGNQLPIPYSNLQIDSYKSNNEEFVYPYFQSKQRRLHTLLKWPNEDVPLPEEIADAGFFYSGIADFVLCYCCGGGLFNWTKEDDPYNDHLMNYSHCRHLSKNICITKIPQSPSKLNILKPGEEDLLLQYPISQRLLGMGLSRHSIKNALKDHLEKYSFLPSTFMDCTDVVVEWEEKNRSKIPNEQSDSLVNDSCKKEENNSSKNDSIEIEKKEKENETLEVCSEDQNLLLELAKQKLKYICKNCKTREIEVITLPCQHFNYCQSCLSNTDVCLTCQRKILKIILPCILR